MQTSTVRWADQVLPRAATTKYLGLHFSDDGSWAAYQAAAVAKGQRIVLQVGTDTSKQTAVHEHEAYGHQHWARAVHGGWHGGVGPGAISSRAT
jgi:hypothetical protein